MMDESQVGGTAHEDEPRLQGALARSAAARAELEVPEVPEEPAGEAPDEASAEAAPEEPPAPAVTPRRRRPSLGERAAAYWVSLKSAQHCGPEHRLYRPREVVAATRAWLAQPTTWWTLLLFAACAVVFVLATSKYWVAVIDDSYITIRFSENLIRGHGLRFNPDGMRVEGFTNFTWMMMLAGALALGMDAMFAAKVLGIGCSLAAMAFAWRFTAALRGKDDTLNLVPVVLLATNSHFQHWAVMGLETHLQVALVMGAYHFFFREMQDRRRWVISPLFAALAAMTRIDSLYYLSPLGVWGAWRIVQCQIPLRRMLAWGGACALLFGTYFAWKVWYFNDIYPNTYYAKVGLDYINTERGIAHLVQFYGNEAGWNPKPLPPPSPSAMTPDAPGRELVAAEYTRWWLRWGTFSGLAWINACLAGIGMCLVAWRARVGVLVLAPIAMQAYYVYHVGGDWMPGFRFFQIALPFLGVACGVGLGLWVETIGRRWFLRWPAYLYAAAVLVGVAFEQFTIDTVWVFGRDPIWAMRRDGWTETARIRSNFAKGFAPPLKEISDELMLRAPAGSWVLMSDIGQPMWFSPHLNLVDVDGLVDKYLADAPSVRGDTFGGPSIRSRDAIRADFADAGIADPQELERRVTEIYRDQIMQRNIRYIMEHVKPDYIVTFEQHPGGNVNTPGYVYPDVVRHCTQHPGFSQYDEVWRGVKTVGVWNHLWKRRDVPDSIPADERLERIRDAIDRNPRMGYLRAMLWREERQALGAASPEATEGLVDAAARFSGDEALVRDLIAAAQNAGDPDLAARVLDAAVRGNPGQPEMLRLLASTYERAGKFAEAAETLERALPHVSTLDNSFHYHLVYLYEMRLHDAERAIQIAEMATRRQPSDLRAWSDYATVAERADRLRLAIDGFEHLLELQGGSDPQTEAKLTDLRGRLAAESKQ